MEAVAVWGSSYPPSLHTRTLLLMGCIRGWLIGLILTRDDPNKGTNDRSSTGKMSYIFTSSRLCQTRDGGFEFLAWFSLSPPLRGMAGILSR